MSAPGPRSSRATLTVLALALALLTAPAALAAKGVYTFDAWAGPSLQVFLSRPEGLGADRPVVFVMHGVKRNADDYRDQWHELALAHDFLLVVPEFSQADFPGARGYNLGYREDEQGEPRPRELWSYAAIEPIFDDVRRRFGMNTPRYALYGHSAGSQFVHRFIYYVPEARVSQIVPANAGWYLMPEPAVAYPYGLQGADVTAEMLSAALGKPVTILLGALDNDPAHRHLRRAPEALAQGPHRLARGQRFFELNRAEAERTGVTFRWRLVTVPGVGHDNRRMAPAAIPHLLP